MAAAAEDLDGQALADALVANHADLRGAQCQELVLAAQWADLHPAVAGAPPGPGGHGTTQAVRWLRDPGGG